jgi:hypothetical protein
MLVFLAQAHSVEALSAVAMVVVVCVAVSEVASVAVTVAGLHPPAQHVISRIKTCMPTIPVLTSLLLMEA